MQLPPSNPPLSDESLAKLRHVRQVIWKSGISGGVLGMLGGVAAWPMLRSLEKRGKLNGVVLEGRHRTGLVLGLGTVMMIVASIAAGKNKSHELHSVFQTGQKPVYTRYEKLRKGDDPTSVNEESSDNWEEYQVSHGSSKTLHRNKYGDVLLRRENNPPS
jgi:hypothetical protein